MATSTPVLQLRKPADSDNVDQDLDLNDNWDKIEDLFDDWTDTWVPVHTSITVGNGTVVAEYKRVGKFVFFRYLLTFGSTTTMAANSNITLPISARAGKQTVVNGDVFDVSADNHFSAGGIIVGGIFAPTTAQGRPTATVPFTWATGDQLCVSGWYETV